MKEFTFINLNEQNEEMGNDIKSDFISLNFICSQKIPAEELSCMWTPPPLSTIAHVHISAFIIKQWEPCWWCGSKDASVGVSDASWSTTFQTEAS